MRSDLPQLAILGGHEKEARRTEARENLADQLVPFDTIEAVKGNLEILARMAATGVVTGSAAGAAVRACEVWLRANETELDTRRIRELELQVRELEASLRQASGRRT